MSIAGYLPKNRGCKRLANSVNLLHCAVKIDLNYGHVSKQDKSDWVENEMFELKCWAK